MRREIHEGGVKFRTDSGAVHYLVQGDLLGRLWSAALSLQDPRVSEVHAAVTIREERMVLLGLRGRFRVQGKVSRRIELEVGQDVELAPNLHLEVLQVVQPRSSGTEDTHDTKAPGIKLVVAGGQVTLEGVSATVPVRGQSGHILRELLSVSLPLEWETLAKQLWGPLPTPTLRRRWDVQMSRLRTKLQQAGAPATLVRANGLGLIELILRQQDRVEHR